MTTYNPGIDPLEYKVIVLPDAVEEVTAGGIIMPDATKDAAKAATVRGVLVSASPIAFCFDDFPEGTAPKVGDRVLMGRYTGSTFEGADKQTYRILNDKDIIGVER